MTEETKTTNIKIKNYNRAYYLKNKEAHLKRVKDWQKKNRDKYIENSAKPLKRKYEALQNGTLNYSIYAIETPEGIYIGCHNWLDKFGNYWGSGTKIKRIVERYGKEVCNRKIIYTVHDSNIAKQCEEATIRTLYAMNIPLLNETFKSGYYSRKFTVNNKN